MPEPDPPFTNPLRPGLGVGSVSPPAGTPLTRPLFVAMLLVGGLVLVSLVIFTPRYQTNDDVSMTLIVAGRAFLDQPDEHLLYSNVLIGLALKTLYQCAPDFPWYGGYLYTVAATSLMVVSYTLLSVNPSRKQLFLTFLVLTALGLPSLVWLQFTLIAFLAVLAGLLLLLAPTGGRFPVRLALGGAPPLLLLGSLIRFESLLLACAVLAPALVVCIGRQARTRTGQLLGLALLSSLALAWGLQRFNRWYYEASEGWCSFYEFNALRAQFTDYRRVAYNEHTRPILARVGWSRTDLTMLCNWSFADADRFSADKMRTCVLRPLAETSTI